MIGGYLGSTFGGLSTDRFGFRVGTNFVLCIEVAIMLVLLLLSIYSFHLKRLTRKQESQFEDRKSELIMRDAAKVFIGSNR